MNPALIFVELGEREVQAISFYLCTRKYWQSSPDSKFFCLKRKHHFVTLECQIFNFLRLRLLWIQLNFCRIGWERGASDLNLLVFVFRIQALSTCLCEAILTLYLSASTAILSDRWASDLIFLSFGLHHNPSSCKSYLSINFAYVATSSSWQLGGTFGT